MLPIIYNKAFTNMNHLVNDLNSFLNRGSGVFKGENILKDIEIEIMESPEKYFINAEINGVDKNDINIDINKDVLTISVEAKRKKEKFDNVNVLYSELFYGKMQRTIRLPDLVEENEIGAKYVDGILSLELKKRNNGVSKKVIIE